MTPAEMEQLADILAARTPPKPNGVVLKVAAAIVVVTGALAGGAWLVDAVLWTEAEAATGRAANTQQHNEIKSLVAEEHTANMLQDLRLVSIEEATDRTDANVQRIADRLSVRGVERAE